MTQKIYNGTTEKFGQLWKFIDCVDDWYLISNHGMVWSCDSQQFLKPLFNRQTGYYYVKLRQNGIRRNFAIHRLVATAFVDNPKSKPQVNHKDENKKNNCADNLEWVSAWENINYGTHNKRSALSRSKRNRGIA